MVDQQDAEADRGSGGEHVLTEAPRHGDAAPDDRDDRTRAHRLDDRGLDVLVGALAGADGFAQTLMGAGRAQQPLPGPSE